MDPENSGSRFLRNTIENMASQPKIQESTGSTFSSVHEEVLITGIYMNTVTNVSNTKKSKSHPRSQAVEAYRVARC
jgi:hypothetical protein